MNSQSHIVLKLESGKAQNQKVEKAQKQISQSDNKKIEISDTNDHYPNSLNGSQKTSLKF